MSMSQSPKTQMTGHEDSEPQPRAIASMDTLVNVAADMIRDADVHDGEDALPNASDTDAHLDADTHSRSASPSTRTPPSSASQPLPPSTALSSSSVTVLAQSRYYEEYEAHLHQHRRRPRRLSARQVPTESGAEEHPQSGAHTSPDHPSSLSLSFSSSSYPRESAPDYSQNARASINSSTAVAVAAVLTTTRRPSLTPSGAQHSESRIFPLAHHEQQHHRRETKQHASEQSLPAVSSAFFATTDYTQLNSSSPQPVSALPSHPSTKQTSSHSPNETMASEMHWSHYGGADTSGYLRSAHLNEQAPPIDFGSDSMSHERRDHLRVNEPGEYLEHGRLSFDYGHRRQKSDVDPVRPAAHRLSSLTPIAPRQHRTDERAGKTGKASESALSAISEPPSAAVSAGTTTTANAVTSQKIISSVQRTLKGPLPIDAQINLLASALQHDPFNCPIRRTTQVWERIAKEQGIRARTCARRYDNIIQASIARRDRNVGTEEQIATKKRLLDQLFVMMNQPQALVRMQKKRRYRSDEADRNLLLEVIRLNPFGQKVGQVAKAWEDVRDAVGMKVHARQCIRKVNRMIKPYQLRDSMYKGNIPEEMQEANDDLVKQVLQLMDLSGHDGSLEGDVGQSNEEDSSGSEDQDEGILDSETPQRQRQQEDYGLDEGEDEAMASPSDANQRQAGADATSRSPSSPTRVLSSQKPSTQPVSPTISESASRPPADQVTFSQSWHRSRHPSHGSKHRSRGSNDMGADGTRIITRALEAEFRPQRIWGSHPYARDTQSRSATGKQLHKDRPSVRTDLDDLGNNGSDVDRHDRPVKIIRMATRSRGENSKAESERLGPILSPDSKRSYRSNLPSPEMLSTGLSSAHLYGQVPSQAHAPGRGRGGEQGQGAIAPLIIQPTSDLYRIILNEFHVVKSYLQQLHGQRQRDKENQKSMYRMIEVLQHQVEEHQQSIQRLQAQMRDGSKQGPSYQWRQSRSVSPQLKPEEARVQNPSLVNIQPLPSSRSQSQVHSRSHSLTKPHQNRPPQERRRSGEYAVSSASAPASGSGPGMPGRPGSGQNESREDHESVLQDRVSVASTMSYEYRPHVKTTLIATESDDRGDAGWEEDEDMPNKASGIDS